MKKFITITLLFILPIILFQLGIEFLVRQVPNIYKFKDNYLQNHSNSIETLVLGNSHTLYGINPEHINSRTFNASHVSQTLDIDYSILKKYSNNINQLETVVIRLSYFSLFEQLGKTNEDWRITNYNLYTNLNLDYKLKHQLSILSIKLNNNINYLKDFYIKDKNMVNCNSYGWGIEANNDINTSLLKLEKTGLSAAKRHTIKNQYLLKENTKILDSILFFCKQKNINVILLTLPAYKSYYNNLDKKQLDITFETAMVMAKKYENTSYFNYLNSSKFDSKDFLDSDHLNKKGAKKFSLIINELINKKKNL